MSTLRVDSIKRLGAASADSGADPDAVDAEFEEVKDDK